MDLLTFIHRDSSCRDPMTSAACVCHAYSWIPRATSAHALRM